MKYRDFLNSCSDEELAEILANDDIFNMACVEHYDFTNNKCPYKDNDCEKCILALLDSDIEEDIVKRD